MRHQVLVHPFLPLLLFSVAHAALLTTYIAAGLEPSYTFQIVASLSWTLLVALWIVADARRHPGIPCFDFGFFCYMFLPLAVPWYCIWSRSWRGLLMLITLTALWLGPHFVATMAWLFVHA